SDSWVRSIHRPIPMTSRPVATPRYASTRCGTNHAEPMVASTPTRMMPLVCESVTKMPSTRASTGRPRAPTMYAAEIGLPCRGAGDDERVPRDAAQERQARGVHRPAGDGGLRARPDAAFRLPAVLVGAAHGRRESDLAPSCRSFLLFRDGLTTPCSFVQRFRA